MEGVVEVLGSGEVGVGRGIEELVGVGVEKDGGTASRRGVDWGAVDPLALAAGGWEELLCVLVRAASGAGDALPPLVLGLLDNCRLSAGNPYPPLASLSPPGLGEFSPVGEIGGALPGLVLGALALRDCPRGRRWMKLSAEPKRFCVGAEGEPGRGTGPREGEGRATVAGAAGERG